jgi:hypothetical protein
MNPRPRLLFLSRTLPYPPDGASMSSYRLLRLFGGAFDVTALCFERPGAARAASHDAREVAGVATIEVFEVPQRHSSLRYLWDHLRSALLRRVYKTYLYQSRAFERRLTDVLSSTPIDIVSVDGIDLVRYLPACGDIPIVCVHHDIQSAALARRARAEKNEWRSAYLRHQAGLMEDAEREWCGRVALNIVPSDEDRRLLERIAPSSHVIVMTNSDSGTDWQVRTNELVATFLTVANVDTSDSITEIETVRTAHAS